MKVRAVLLAVAMMVAVTALADGPEWAQGLCGEKLKEAVRAHCSPAKTLPDGELWGALLNVEGVEEGEVVNRFGKKNFQMASGQEGMTKMLIADKSWWMPDYVWLPTYANDLHVSFVCDEATLEARQDYMPGVVSGKVLYDGEVWKAGEDESGQGVWSFPEGYEGEMARAMLYVACVYPSDLWVGEGAVFMEAGVYPSLSGTAIAYLLEAHDNELPTEREVRRNEAIAGVQGNGNPFVQWPDMAAHIWGDKKDVPYCNIEDPTEEDADNEGEGGCENKPVPLHGIYTQADKTVDLVSSYVPDNAVWSVDGEMVEGRQIAVSELLPGKHELRFEAGSVRGKIVIFIAD